MGKTPGIIDNEADAGGYEEYPEEKRAADFDTDGDGLPNWWEELHGTDPNSEAGDFSDANADPDKDGYTNLEEYLDWMSVPHFTAKQGEAISADLAPLFMSYEQPAFHIEGNPDATTDGSKMTIKTDAMEKGLLPSHEGDGHPKGKRHTGVCPSSFHATKTSPNMPALREKIQKKPTLIALYGGKPLFLHETKPET